MRKNILKKELESQVLGINNIFMHIIILIKQAAFDGKR
jgi:hypothetical protein